MPRALIGLFYFFFLPAFFIFLSPASFIFLSLLKEGLKNFKKKEILFKNRFLIRKREFDNLSLSL
ncbi:hypothetical protein TPE_0231 [Treponema pedis str. T A4]|uniref:Uncharacterized protein n=1 Tax=Treponema pedis str. T A4 TaxID=1291379 RepID=S5ZJK5_9SPIR|nr:hypothetical protein TPE_0231 [Treponema pedis str. T A4]